MTAKPMESKHPEIKRKVGTVTDHRFGFPVILVDAPLRQVRGEWIPEVNAALLKQAVLAALVVKPCRLTGDEVRFIRLGLELSQAAFGRECDMTHAAVSKWEAWGSEATRMKLATEFYIRWLAMEHLPPECVARMVDQPAGNSLLHTFREIREKLKAAESPCAEPNQVSVPASAIASSGYLATAYAQ